MYDIRVKAEDGPNPRWILTVDGGRVGMYSTENGAKSAARKFYRTNRRVKWSRTKDGGIKASDN